MPLRAMVVVCVALAVFRVAINVADSGVIDVGYAGVIGADRIVDGEAFVASVLERFRNPFLDHRLGGADLPLASVDEQQLRWVGELPRLLPSLGDGLVALVHVGLETAAHHLGHRRVVVAGSHLVAADVAIDEEYGTWEPTPQPQVIPPAA